LRITQLFGISERLFFMPPFDLGQGVRYRGKPALCPVVITVKCREGPRLLNKTIVAEA
jgi:hypothetical protein